MNMEKTLKNLKKWQALNLIMAFLLILSSCRTGKMGGALPLYMDEFVSTTKERRFKLKEEIEGHIIEYQRSYDCINDSILYNATAIIKSESDFLTIYDYCQQKEFKKGDKVIVKSIEIEKKEYYVREINRPFSQNSGNYGYWQCISCKYKNAFGKIELINE